MNIGIIVFSRTGNTLAVAEKIRDACVAKGHQAAIERVHAENEDPGDRTPVRLRNAPNPAAFDCVIFGAPVEGFSLPAIMKAYLQRIPSISGKRVGCFVTQRLPKPWLGGNRAVKQMCALCGSKGAEMAESGIVNWSNPARGAQIADIAARFGRIGG